MPKQLLRFALSRLDVLDAQALDLDNLDFALGRNSVLEFRDVGLVLQVRGLIHDLLRCCYRSGRAPMLTRRVTCSVETREVARAPSLILDTKGQGLITARDDTYGFLQ